jgi:hypothetical protein
MEDGGVGIVWLPYRIVAGADVVNHTRQQRGARSNANELDERRRRVSCKV